MNRDLHWLRDGALAGLVATGAMSMIMLLGQQLVHRGQQPPRRIVEAALDNATGQAPNKELTRLLSVPAHFAFGAVAGALFGWMRRRLRRESSPLGLGMVYGLAVWAASYKGWVPALGILPAPERDRPGRAQTVFASHLVYGAVLGAVTGRQQG